MNLPGGIVLWWGLTDQAQGRAQPPMQRGPKCCFQLGCWVGCLVLHSLPWVEM